MRKLTGNEGFAMKMALSAANTGHGPIESFIRVLRVKIRFFLRRFKAPE